MKKLLLTILPTLILANSMINKTLPAVVNIYLDEKDHKHHTLGSGVIIDNKNGYILTNAHVVKKFGNIIVTLENKNYYQAKIIGSDPDSDIAVLKIDAPDLKQIDITYKNVGIGEKIYTIGNPYGLSNTVTSGIISAKGRQIGLEKYENFLQTDAPINPGNSGGALINEQGKLIGINTAVFSNSGSNIGLGFAIPAFIFGPVSEQLIKYGHMNRSTLGVYVQNLTPRLAAALKTKTVNGVIVSKVIPNSNADRLGIKPMDIIIQIGPNLVNSFVDLNSAVGVLRVNDDFNASIFRKGKNIRIKGKFNKQPSNESKNILSGLILSPISYWSDNDKAVSGLRIVDIKKDSKAWIAGLRTNDILVSVDGDTSTKLDEMNQFEDKKSLLVTVKRAGIEKFIVVE